MYTNLVAMLPAVWQPHWVPKQASDEIRCRAKSAISTSPVRSSVAVGDVFPVISLELTAEIRAGGGLQSTHGDCPSGCADRINPDEADVCRVQELGTMLMRSKQTSSADREIYCADICEQLRGAETNARLYARMLSRTLRWARPGRLFTS